MTGAYLRVERKGRWESIEVEKLTDEERLDKLGDDSRLLQWLNLVCEKLNEAEKILDELADEGIITKGYSQ